MENTILIELLKNIDLEAPKFRPTEIYNEGWLLRIILNEYSKLENSDGELKFSKGSTWFSEAMLPTKFKARSKKEIGRKDELAESRTNADGVIGHINVGEAGKADFHLLENVTQFVVIEAKMTSKLTEYVSNVPGYDQAARTVACMAEALRCKKIHPDRMTSLAYYVLAPEKQIGKSNFKKLVNENSIRNVVRKRVDGYLGEKDYKIYDEWYENWFKPTLEEVELDVLSWEFVIESLQGDRKEQVDEFYQCCKKFN